jgi:lysophospholipid acyltransferase (LPLAT)-like uncharacterized protein
MKIHHPRLRRFMSAVAGEALQAWMKTVRMREESFGQCVDPADPRLEETLIYALWHENLLAATLQRSVKPVTVLASNSRDGAFGANLCQKFGVGCVRGSPSAGGIDAVTQLIEVGKSSHLIIAPDGSRGPRRVVKRGLPYLAAWSQMRIVPLGVGFGRAWRANSWDRFAVPYPFSNVYFVAGPTISVPAGLKKHEMEEYRVHIEHSIQKANDAAEAWAAGAPSQASWPVPTVQAA